MRRDAFKEGLRAGIPIAAAVGAVGLSFGVIAEPVIGAGAALATSAFVFAGSAQFGSVAVLGAGGGIPAAVTAAILLNARYIPMGIALAPSLRGRWLRRALYGEAMIDASWAMASRGGGRFDPDFMVGATIPSYPAWVGGTALGLLLGDQIVDPAALGLEALFPAFFLALLVKGEFKRGRLAVITAACGVAIALALTPFTQVGLPVIAASAAALIGLAARSSGGGPEDHPEIEGDPVG